MDKGFYKKNKRIRHCEPAFRQVWQSSKTAKPSLLRRQESIINLNMTFFELMDTCLRRYDDFLKSVTLVFCEEKRKGILSCQQRLPFCESVGSDGLRRLLDWRCFARE